MTNDLMTIDKLNIDEGLYFYEEKIKILLLKNNPEIFDVLDFDEEGAFCEPLLFAYFNSDNSLLTIEQIIYSYIKPDRRPKIKAYADNKGRIYIPKMGYFIQQHKDQYLDLFWDDDQYMLQLQHVNVDYSFEPCMFLPGTEIEILAHPVSLLAPHFIDAKGRPIDIDISAIAILQRDNLIRAINMLKRNAPEFYSLFCRSIKTLVIFNDPTVKGNSFATLSVHGCAFFNAFQDDYNEIFFIEDLSHQCGHVIFNNLLYQPADYLKADPGTIIKEKGLVGIFLNMVEKRTLFVAFHALYTYYVIARSIDACLTAEHLKPEAIHELKGRLAYTMQKYAIDLNLLDAQKNDSPVYFNENGYQLFSAMKEFYLSLKSKWQKDMLSLKLNNQPYNFSYKKFLKANPL